MAEPGKLPAQRPPSAPKAPRPLRLKSQQCTTTLPPGAHALVDSLVGTFYGSTRSEVARFIIVSWLHGSMASVTQVLEKQKR